ncbi:MAG: ECF-type sigma factor [Gemmataceae bacterium]|nr:ECF-type sigma factor [Gemmataceae bacterium]
MAAEGSITRWIGRLKGGDSDAAQKLWEVYFARMVELARHRLQSAPRRAADEEDVALSAFHSFCQGALGGRFSLLADRNNLWSLLVAITAHKCVDLVRRENRHKRRPGVDAVPSFDELISHEPSPEFAAEVAEQLDRLLALLDATGDADLKPIALAKMHGDSAAEIAARLGCVRRTVERKLQVIVRIWEREGAS